MKKTLYYGLMMSCLLGVSPLTAMAQTQQVLERGDSLRLTAPDNYTSYQWQVSTDLKNFVNLDGEKKQTLERRVYAPAFYRVKGVAKDYSNIYSDTTEVLMSEIIYAPKHSESGAGHGYVIDSEGYPVRGGITIPEEKRDKNGIVNTFETLRNWTDQSCRAVYFFHHPQSTVDTDMLIKVNKDKNVTLRLTIWDPNDMTEPLAENIAAFRGTGKTDTIRFAGVRMPNSAYYRYEIECLNGLENIVEISKFLQYSPSRAASYKPNYLNSPSVHLKGWQSTESEAPSGQSYDWCYLEVMMPKEANYPNTYIMSLGVLDGYMGIQMNGWNGNTPKHDVIFSMWDHGSTDEDPNLPDNLRANVVDHGPGVKTERFANEGTGMKSFKSGNNWDCDTFVQFITNCRPEDATYTVKDENGKEKVIHQKNTLVSTWFNAQDGKGWQYMATLRLANKSVLFDSWYSFLENFYTYPDGMLQRKGFYRNGYAHSMAKSKWYHFNKVNFGNTDGGTNKGARDDFGQGISELNDSIFFMTTGGFTSRYSKKRGATVTLNAANTPVDTINLDKLLQRVDEAVANEKKTIEEKENFKNNKLDKEGWKIVSFSSEEASGEGSNGRADLIIDDDESTYWHSQWQGDRANYPHELVIDMAEEHLVNGIQLTTTNKGGNRHIKDCNLYLSVDNSKWEKVYEGKSMPNKDVHQILLEQAVNARYLKIEITDGYATEGPFVIIKEVDVTESKQTGIESLNANGKFEVSSRQQSLFVKCPANLENAEISVYRTDGACIFNGTYPSLYEGEVIRVPMFTAPQGIYVVTCKAKNLNVSKQVMYNK